MNDEMIKIITYNNYDDYQYFNFIFSQKFISII